MVLEHIFPDQWLERKAFYAFILALAYSSLSIVIARVLFSANSGLVAVMFTSLLLLPYLQKLFVKEERIELHEHKGLSIKKFLLDNKKVVQVYLALFFGVYLSFMLYAFFLPLMGFDTGVVFREQLALESGLRGNAASVTGAVGIFWDIFLNNWWVLLACFLLALVTGDGAIFFIVWNASTWGAIFGARAIAAADVGAPIFNLLLIVLITFPHVLLEASAYIFAAIAGAVVSEDVVSESKEIPIFLGYLLAGMACYVIIALTLSTLLLPVIVSGLLYVILMCGVLLLLACAFTEKKHEAVYLRNCYLFFFAIAIFCVGAFVEANVLSSSTLLTDIYAAAR